MTPPFTFFMLSLLAGLVIILALVLDNKYHGLSNIMKRKGTMHVDRKRGNGKQKTVMTNTPVPTEVKIGRQVNLEFTRIKDKISDDIDLKDIKRISILQLKSGRRAVLITRKTYIPGMPFASHYIDYSQLQNDGKLRFDLMYSEPLDPETGKPKFSQELELLCVDGVMTQAIEVASTVGQFKLTRTMVIMMLISGTGFFLVMLGLNSVAHFTPTQIVHWFPVKPHFS